MWADAKGYKDFGWKNQDVYAVGGKYENDGTWYGVGYNYAKNPITTYNTGGNPMSAGAAMNMFNYLMFPATSEHHFTIGAGTNITEHFSLDLSMVYSPSSNVTVDTTIGPLKVEHQETSVAMAMRYNF